MILYTSALDAWCKAALKVRAVTPRRIVCSYATREEWPTTQHSPTQIADKRKPAHLAVAGRGLLAVVPVCVFALCRAVTFDHSGGYKDCPKVLSTVVPDCIPESVAFYGFFDVENRWSHVILRVKKNPGTVTARGQRLFRPAWSL